MWISDVSRSFRHWVQIVSLNPVIAVIVRLSPGFQLISDVLLFNFSDRAGFKSGFNQIPKVVKKGSSRDPVELHQGPIGGLEEVQFLESLATKFFLK